VALGCSLQAHDRPTICLRYMCLDLRAELRDDARWVEIARIGAELRDTFAALIELLEREPGANASAARAPVLPQHVVTLAPPSA
jgi:hypothetical protein